MGIMIKKLTVNELRMRASLNPQSLLRGSTAPIKTIAPACYIPSGLIAQCRSITANANSGTAGTTGTYTAADEPEMRKNPLLYNELHTPSATASPNAAAALDAAPAAADANTSSPAVSYLVTPSSSAEAAGVGRTRARGLVKPEVLAPVGGWPQLYAAVENGADCVYFGLTDFNARARASNFTPEELHQVMDYLHARGVKGFVTFNILVFDSELGDVEARVRAMAAAGVDALIVQDLGVVELVRRIAPGLPVHGSTQMSITSAEGAEFAGGLGVERVVVGRELSVREIAKVREGSEPEVEAFVHGALCVSYSGQCFSSEAWGGRSANRGQCAQACRLPYGLLVDGALAQMGDMKYLLSPTDLMAVEAVPGLIAAGVSCFKIEGRLKGPEYVALTTQVYRRAVDAAWAALTGVPPPSPPARAPKPTTSAALTSAVDATSVPASTVAAAGISPEAMAAAQAAVSLDQRQRWELEQVFARGQDGEYSGLTPGFLAGVAHQRLVRGRAPRHRGVFVGRVVRVLPALDSRPDARDSRGGTGSGYGGRSSSGSARGGYRGGGRGARDSGSSARVLVELSAPLKRGDGLVFDAGSPEDKEEGGNVYDLLDDRNRSVPGEVAPLPVQGDGHTMQAAEAGGRRKGARAPAPASGIRDGGRTGANSVGESIGSSTQLAQVVVVFGGGQVDVSRVKPGDLVWRNKDNALEAKLHSTYDGLASSAVRREPVSVRVTGSLGSPLTITLRDAQGRETCASSHIPLAPASSRPLGAADIEKAIGTVLDAGGGSASGEAGTLAVSGAVDVSGLALDQGLFLPAGEIKAVRRSAADALAAARISHTRHVGLADHPVLPVLLSEVAYRNSLSGASGAVVKAPKQKDLAASAVLRVLCRTPAQVTAALAVPWLQEVVLDFLEVQGLKEAVREVQASGRRAVVATPRVLKPDEERLVHFYMRLRADALLLRSAGLMHQLARLGGTGAALHGLTAPDGTPLAVPRLQGDFSLNAANTLSADLLLGPRGPLERLTPTHDLSAAQVAGMAKALGGLAPGSRACALEAVLHQHLPIFHTEHCVFCRFLSSGNSYKDCGHPCEKHTVHLRDSEGADHLVLADMGCRNTVFNAQAQSGAFFAADLLRAGVGTFRVELVDEPADCVAPLLQGYRDLLDGERSPGDLWSWLRTLPDANGRAHGVSPGSLGGGNTRGDRPRESMKPTAASLKAAQKQQGGSTAAGQRMPV